MFNMLKKYFSVNFAIDLGTANTIIYQQDKGIILDEPSIVALTIDKGSYTKRVLAVGQEAKIMLGRTPGQIEVVRPMKDGVIADFQVTEQMIKYFIKSVDSKHRFISLAPTIVICVPCGSTQVERRAIRESAMAAGARRVELIEEAMAAALGAGLPVESAQASMVVDIGGGTTEIGVTSLGGLVYADSIRIAGDKLDDVINNYVRNTHGLLIGDSAAEMIKKTLGNVHPSFAYQELSVRGRSVFDGLPKELVLNSDEIRAALSDVAMDFVSAIKKALNTTPPELSADLIDSGIVLTGGGALLHGLPELVSEYSNIKTTIAEEPLLCVAKGCGIALNYLDNNKIYFNRIK